MIEMNESDMEAGRKAVEDMKTAMQEFELTAPDLAIRIHCATSTVRLWIAGEIPPPPYARALRRALRELRIEGPVQRKHINETARINAYFDGLKPRISNLEMAGLIQIINDGRPRREYLAALERLALTHGLDLNSEPPAPEPSKFAEPETD